MKVGQTHDGMIGMWRGTSASHPGDRRRASESFETDRRKAAPASDSQSGVTAPSKTRVSLTAAQTRDERLMIPSRRKIGLRDVAKVAGVSTATVSRAMNKPETVSEELRSRIASVVCQLGWVPDGTARALATKRTHTIGAIFPTLTHCDFARAIQALQNELASGGYTLLLACSEYHLEQELSQAQKLIERGVDALILVGEKHHAELEALLRNHDILCVNTFVYNPSTHGTCIGPDNRKALDRLTSYLADLGHRRFGVVAQSTENNDRAQARLQGIRDALAERSLAIRAEHFAEGFWGIAEGRKLFRQIVETKPAPTAVICGNAYLAVGAMLESQAMHIGVPEEISIAGYDDIEIMAELPIPITTVRVLSDEVGRLTARFLMARLEGRKEHFVYECDAEIVVRSSTGPVSPDRPITRRARGRYNLASVDGSNSET
jgi:LacI family transcriptional regulator